MARRRERRETLQRTGTGPPAAPTVARAFDWPLVAGLIVVTLAVYMPVWHGGMLWDDDAHLTRPALRSFAGLARIWFDVGATQQYYPVTHSAFWVMQRLWGADTLGYHLVNIGLHATSAFVLFRILQRLDVPGARLAAVVFALHPVQVESVGWMTELKNTLSTALALGAALAYVAWDDARDDRRRYATAFLLYGLSLGAKSVTATVPAALLVLAWWRRGRVSWQRDVRPLLPFFAAGLAAGLMTAWFERAINGARGAEFQLSIVERVLVAGRAIWFYLASTLWPVSLSFIYPRWTIHAGAGWQYLFPIAVLAALAAAWLMRTRSRTPLAVALLFCGLLFPALGFFDVYPFRFSFVADHFQYLATIPVIALVSAALVTATARVGAPHAVERGLILILGVPLATMTFRQSRLYTDPETLFLATLARNPGCWMCHDQLAAERLYGPPEGLAEAVAHLRASLRLYPSNADAHNSMGGVLQRLGKYDEALAEHAEAARLNPLLVQARYNLGVCKQALGRLEEARADYVEAIRMQPDYALAHHNLGTVLQRMGRLDDAAREIGEAVRLEPSFASAHANLAGVLLQLGKTSEATAEYREAIRLDPRNADAHHGLGAALAAAGRLAEAEAEFNAELTTAADPAAAHVSLAYLLLQANRPEDALTHLREVVRLQHGSPQALIQLAAVLQRLGKIDEALVAYRQAIDGDAGNADAHYQLALTLAGSHRLDQAMPEFATAVRLAPGSAEMHHDYGAALANAGRYREAVDQFREALRIKPDFAEARANLDRFSRVR